MEQRSPSLSGSVARRSIGGATRAKRTVYLPRAPERILGCHQTEIVSRTPGAFMTFMAKGGTRGGGGREGAKRETRLVRFSRFEGARRAGRLGNKPILLPFIELRSLSGILSTGSGLYFNLINHAASCNCSRSAAIKLPYTRGED